MAVTNRKLLQLAGSTLAKIKALAEDNVIQPRELLVATDTGEVVVGLAGGQYKVLSQAKAPVNVGVTSDKATAPTDLLFFDKTEGKLYVHDGSTWAQVTTDEYELPEDVLHQVDEAEEDNIVTFDEDGGIQDSGFKFNDSGSTNKDIWSATKVAQAITDAVNGLSWQAPVKSVVTQTPGTASAGDRYLVIVGDSGSDSNANKIIEKGTSDWKVTEPVDGMAVFVEDTDAQYSFNGTSWVNISAGFTYTSGNGINISNNVVSVKAKDTGVVTVTADGVDVATGDGIDTTGKKIAVKIKENSVLTASSDGLDVSVGNAIDTTGSKLDVKVKANSGLTVATDGLATVIKTNGGIVVDSEGLSLGVDNSSIILNTTGKLEVKDLDFGTF